MLTSNIVVLSSVVAELRDRIYRILEKSKQNREAIALIKAMTEQIAERLEVCATDFQDSRSVFADLDKIIIFTQDVDVILAKNLEGASHILCSVEAACVSAKDGMLGESVATCREMLAGVVDEMQEMRRLVVNVRCSQEQLASTFDTALGTIVYH